MAVTLRVELWTRLACEGGAALGALRQILSATAARQVADVPELTLTASAGEPLWAEVREQRVLHTVDATGQRTEWIIQSVTARREGDALLGELTATGVAGRLAQGRIIERVEADGRRVVDLDLTSLTPTQLLTDLIAPGGVPRLPWLAVGVVTPTQLIALQYRAETMLTAITQIAAAAGCEWQVRPATPSNLALGYLVDLTTIGASTPTLDVRLSRNLDGVARRGDGAQQATAILPLGRDEDGVRATMRRAAWRVTAVTATTVDLADPAGGDGPIAFDGQLNETRLALPDGSLRRVIDSLVLTQRCTIEGASLLGVVAIGDLLTFRADLNGSDLIRVTDPSAVSLYGVIEATLEVPDATEDVNQLRNPALRNYPNPTGDPPNWLSTGAGVTVTRTVAAGDWESGGAAARVATTTPITGLRTDFVPIPPGTEYVSGFIRFRLLSGAVRIRLLLRNAMGLATVLPDSVGQFARSNRVGAFDTLGVAGIDVRDGANNAMAIELVQDAGTPSVFLVDAAQLTTTADQVPFVEGSGGTALWQAANAALRQRSRPPQRYEVRLRDRYRAEPGVWPDSERLQLGQPVQITDAALGVQVVTRLLGIRQNLLDGTDTEVTLSTAAQELSPVVTTPRRATPIAAPRTAAITPVSESGSSVGPGTSGRLAKFTGSNTLGDSLLQESGGAVVLGIDPGGAELFRATSGRFTVLHGLLTRPEQPNITEVGQIDVFGANVAVIGPDPGGGDRLRVGGTVFAQNLTTSGTVQAGSGQRLRFGPAANAAGRYVVRAGFGSPVALELTNAEESAYADLRVSTLYGFNSAVVGADPGGALPLRVGGGARINGDSEFVSTSGNRNVYITRPAGALGYLSFRTGSSDRWSVLVNGATESGSNQGSNFRLDAYSDAGAYLRTNLEIVRATGHASFSNEVLAPVFTTAANRFVLSAPSGNGTLQVGDGVVTGQFYAAGERVFAGTIGGVAFGLITAGTERWQVTAGGNLIGAVDNTHDIGAASSGRPRNLYVGSAIVAGGDITAFSDARLKHRTRPVTGALALVQRLHPVWFEWKAKADAGQQLGLLAQNVRDVVPEVVRCLDDVAGTLTVDYSKLVALLIAAVQELQLERSGDADQ